MRHARTLMLLGLCLALVACERKPRASDRPAPDPPVPARPRPVPAKPDAAVPRPDAAPAPVPGAMNLPRPTPMSKDAFLPTVAPPTWKQLQPLVRSPGLRGPIASSTIVPLGGTRFAAVARMTDRIYGTKDAETGVQPGDYALVLITVEPDGTGWKVVQQLRVWDQSVGDPCQTDEIPVSVTAGDLDHDGRPEIELRIRAGKSERAVGCISRAHLVLVDLHPAPRLLLVDDLDARGVYVTTSVLRYEDLNADGFPDVHITETTRRADPGDGDMKYDPEDRRYLYDPVNDAYLKGGKRIRPSAPAFFKDSNDPDWRDPNFR